MPVRQTLLTATAILSVGLGLAQGHCGWPGWLLTGGSLACGLTLWLRQRRRLQHTAEAQTQALRQEVAALQHHLAAQRLEYDTLRDARARDAQAQQDWLMTISQELRTPLHTIIGYSELLQEEPDQMAGHEVLADMHELHEASQQLRRLIHDMHDLAKLATGSMAVCYETVDLALLIEEVCTHLRPWLQEQAHTCEVHLAADLGTVATDRPKLRRSLENILRQVALLTPQPTLVCRAWRETRAATEWVVLQVDISSPGADIIAPEAYEEPSSLGEDGEGLQRYGGTGLGLVVSQRLCRLLGGELTFTGAGQSQVMGCIRLPVVRPTPVTTCPSSEHSEPAQRQLAML